MLERAVIQLCQTLCQPRDGGLRSLAFTYKPAAQNHHFVNILALDAQMCAQGGRKRVLIIARRHPAEFKKGHRNRGNRKIKAMLEKGVIGKPFMIRVRFAHNGPIPGWAKDKWFHDPKIAGGGAMLDMGIHAKYMS